ncbi:MAG: hypothetical protein U0872_08295 [Planctomycetaceae bacterium]
MHACSFFSAIIETRGFLRVCLWRGRNRRGRCATLAWCLQETKTACAIRGAISRSSSETCWRLLGHREDAEDVTQESLTQPTAPVAVGRPARPVQPWVLAIAVNRCRTLMAKRKRLPHRWRRKRLRPKLGECRPPT